MQKVIQCGEGVHVVRGCTHFSVEVLPDGRVRVSAFSDEGEEPFVEFGIMPVVSVLDNKAIPINKVERIFEEDDDTPL